MGYTEYHIDGRYKLYGRLYHAAVGGVNLNPFFASHRTIMAASTDPPTMFHMERFNQIDALGIFADDGLGNKFIPLNAHLVIPDGVGTAPYPLAVFIHGQARNFFHNDRPIPEVESYRGYRYLQQYLGEKGLASVSVNVNVASFLGGGAHPDFEPQERIQITALILALLFQLSNSPASVNQPVFLKRSNGSLSPLQDALALSPPFVAGSQESQLMQLRDSLRGKLSFSSLGFMGHSRGGDAVQILTPFFSPRVGPAPADYTTTGASAGRSIDIPSGPYNSNTITSNNSLSFHNHLYHHIMDIMAVIGSPGMGAVKTVVALQPSSEFAVLDSASTFFLVVSSSHDADVQEGSFNSYDNVNCPKAMIFSHGASHGRFNSVWRQLDYIRRQFNQQIMCQSPIRMLSIRGHENLAKATVGNAFLAAMLNENHRYAFYPGEFRATGLGQDIERAWKFPFPFASPPAMRLIDKATIRATNLTTGTGLASTAVSRLASRQVAGHENYANEVDVTAFTRPATESVLLRIPLPSAERLVARTHFSFRYGKEYNAHLASSRRAAQLRNYTLRLKSATGTIGGEIAGSSVPSLHHLAYPVKDHDGSTCEEDTVIVLQTAEVPLSQFLALTGQPTTDLSQVTTIEIQLNAISGATGDDTFFFVDFLLSTRNLPALPSGFDLP